MPRTGAGELRTRNKNKTTCRHCTPRAAKTRAMQLCSIHSDVKSRRTERQRPHQTPEDPNPALVSLQLAPRLLFMCALELFYVGESAAILRVPLRFI
jgi:hypothetical protein